jgi:NAD(P)-dependent dehydrogenase (short-subunit alcohol dehydrogenase family)
MKNKVVLITGANGGLGSVVTEKFLGAGAAVVGASRKITGEDFPHSNFLAISADLTKAAGVHGTIESVVTRFGKLDVLVHVLGGFAGGQTVADTDDATWERMQELNLTSAFYALRSGIPHLRKSTAGRIIAIGSLAATQAHPKLGAYVTFKSALVTLVQTAALENKDTALTANVVLPGTMDTAGNRKSMPSADFSKWVQPSDVADLVVWLSDDKAGHITGAVFPIEGRN